MKLKDIKNKIGKILSNKKSLFVTIPLAIFAIYTAFGFWGVPLIAQKIAPYFLEKKGIFLKIDEFKFNPFTYEVNATQVDLSTFAPLFSAEKIDAKLDFKKLFERSVNVEILRLQSPVVAILKEHNATFNFEPFSSSDESKSAADHNDTDPFFNIMLDHVQIHNGTLAYDDRSLIAPFDIKFDDINYEIQGINLFEHTIGRHTFGANSKIIKNIQWDGGIDINPLQIYGRIVVDDLKISPFWISFLEKQNLKVEQGTVNSTINYSVIIDDEISILLQDSNLTLSNLTASEGNKTVLIQNLDIPLLNFEAHLAKDKNATLSIAQINANSVDYDSLVQTDTLKFANIAARFDMDENATLGLDLEYIMLKDANFRDKNTKYALQNLTINDIKTSTKIDINSTALTGGLGFIKFDDFFFQGAGGGKSDGNKDRLGGDISSFIITSAAFELNSNDKQTLSFSVPKSEIAGINLDLNSTKASLAQSTFDDFTLKIDIDGDIMLAKGSVKSVDFRDFLAKNVKLSSFSLNLPTFSLNDINLDAKQQADNTSLNLNLENIITSKLELMFDEVKLSSDLVELSRPKIEVKNSEILAVLEGIKLSSPKAAQDKFELSMGEVMLSNLEANSANNGFLTTLGDLNATKASLLYAGKNFINLANLTLKNSTFNSDKNQSMLNIAAINLGKTDIFSGEKIFGGGAFATAKELRFDIKNSDLKIADILLDGAKFNSIIDEKGVAAINNLEILKQSPTPTSTKPVDKKPLKFNIKNAKISNGEVKISENFSSNYLDHAINAISFEAQNISNKGSFSFKTSANSSDNISLKSSGAVSLLTPSLDANLSIEASNLSKFSPFIQRFLDAKITGGKANYSGKIAFDGSIELNGKANVTNLNIKDSQNSDFFAIKSLNLNSIIFKNDELLIDKIDIKSPFLKVAVAKDRSLNIVKMIKTEPKQEQKSQKSEFKFALSNINLEDGSMDFSDHSLFLPFDIAIKKLKTSIDIIKESAPANLKLSGVVGERGLSQITLNAMPFEPKHQSEFSMIYKDIELKNITPYSAKFVGYEIKNGRANLNLHYTISDSKLSAKNDINLDTLQLGGRVESPDAMNLPLELAISILKDSNDQINISLPVSGDLSDPDFSYGGIVISAITKLFADIVLSPFRLIGNILGIDADKLNGIDFTAGSDEILDSELPKLDDLKKIALAKPEIRLTITPSYSEKIDTLAYQKSYLDSEIALLMNRNGLSYSAAISQLQRKYLPSFKGSQTELLAKLIEAKKFTTSKLDELALQRAENIKEKLEDLGVNGEQISVKKIKNVTPKQGTFIMVEMGVENR